MLSGLCVTCGTITPCVTCCRWKEGQRLSCPVMVLQRRRTTRRRNLQKKGINGTKYALYSISSSVLDRGRTCWHRITLCLTVLLWRGRTYNRTDIDPLPLIVCPWEKEAYNISDYSIWPSVLEWGMVYRLTRSLSSTVLEWRRAYNKTDCSIWLSLSEGGHTTK